MSALPIGLTLITALALLEGCHLARHREVPRQQTCVPAVFLAVREMTQQRDDWEMLLLEANGWFHYSRYDEEMGRSDRTVHSTGLFYIARDRLLLKPRCPKQRPIKSPQVIPRLDSAQAIRNQLRHLEEVMEQFRRGEGPPLPCTDRIRKSYRLLNVRGDSYLVPDEQMDRFRRDARVRSSHLRFRRYLTSNSVLVCLSQ